MKEKLITAEAGTSLFQPDLLLPAQFFAALKQKAQACGERRLMVAILEDAVVCFQKHLWATDGRSRQLGAEAERWFLSDDSSWLGVRLGCAARGWCRFSTRSVTATPPR